jgi:hypothetical protein
MVERSRHIEKERVDLVKHLADRSRRSCEERVDSVNEMHWSIQQYRFIGSTFPKVDYHE